MSFSFDNPLYIGDKDAAVKSDIAELQSEVGDLSQLETGDKSSLVNALNEAMDSTLNGASRDLDNLSDAGNEKLRSLNSYANKGELLTDAEGLADVKSYAHSTFDASKFTLVGSPNITDDGIASGFSDSNYITTASIDLSTANSWEIQVRFKTPTTRPSSGNPCVLGINGIKIRLYINVNGLCIFYIDDYSNNLTFFYENDTFYDVKCGYKDGKAYFEYKKDSDSDYTKTTPVEKTATNANGIAYIGKRADGAEPYFSGSIDLKQFSITVDGVEVFSGNKTGIDTIKPDDYTVEGTQHINDAGILSGSNLPGSGYTKMNNTLDLTKAWEVHCKVTTGAVITTQQILFSLGGYNQADFANRYYFSFFIWTTQQFGMNGSTTGVAWSFTGDRTPSSAPLISANTTYWLKVGWDKAKYYVQISEDGINYVDYYSIAEVDSMYTYTTRVDTINGCAHYAGLREGTTLDLNEFKVYSEGNLVYQPCLKIPYTESKTGSKIVDAIYRERVNDMAEQFGFANYYTLDEDNGNFTLPQVELYGLIGQRTLRDSYRNGINYWELYSNRDLEQGGSCTSGVEVTFARPFADTNYVLSVPYSAKSTTAFTPTQTGDWIAKGKGIL